ncbi:glycosyltransferase family 4 protein [Actinospongicola halichondriae]|uniref:glycosyltransferase family 4 protein n=1 Tax=Actinospongicola halichondriae TaxID=3236844 RepID=UPI003D50EBB2
MRVLMVADFYEPYVGGVEQHVRSLSHGLVDRGHEVAVATTATARAPRGVVADGPVAVHRIPTLSARFGRAHAAADRPWAPPIVDPVASRHLRRLVRSWAPDVVHGHDWLARSATPWCRDGGPAFVATQHYYTRSCARKDLWRDGAVCAGPTLRGCVACTADTYGAALAVPVTLGTRLGARSEDRASRATIAVSEATATGNRTPPGYSVIPNLLPPPRIAAPSEVESALDALPLPPVPFVLFIGDLRPTKGFHTLLDALSRLDDPPALVVVGERDRSSPDELPAHVHHLGTVDNALVGPLLERSRFAVVPSVWAEPFGIVAIEAMTAGRAVVASDTGGLGELVEPGVTGLLTPPGDAVALAGAIEELWNDPERAEAMGRAGRTAASRYRPERVVPLVEAVYETVVRNGR